MKTTSRAAESGVGPAARDNASVATVVKKSA
jgi:hypothetical protein